LRDSKWISIDSKYLVPGDIVELRTGDKVPADIRIIQLKTAILKTDQSSLTGETDPVLKDNELVE